MPTLLCPRSLLAGLDAGYFRFNTESLSKLIPHGFEGRVCDGDRPSSGRLRYAYEYAKSLGAICDSGKGTRLAVASHAFNQYASGLGRNHMHLDTLVSSFV
jgi:hypothetical protein